ncbi:MAG: hypothetical protein Q7S10_01070 [bacterium]|nr:hypothetical protein [bacterium]
MIDKVLLVGVAGGSGSGKSTLCESLREKYPETIGLVQLDDYYKPDDQIPKLNGMENLECPEALFIERFVNDLSELEKNVPVVINTKNSRLNPSFSKTQKRIPAVFHPRPIILVEGFLVLAIESIRKKFFASLWLDVPHGIRLQRRIHLQSDEYKQTILVPMHEKYAEPSKQYASRAIDASVTTATRVLCEAEAFLFEVVQELFNNQPKKGKGES